MKALGGDAQAMKHKPGSHSATGGKDREPGRCRACGTEVPPKPGFRFASLKCPKCGKTLGQQ
jgi:hypothetical protein